MIEVSEQKKEVFRYKKDEKGHLMCHMCDFKPKPTKASPLGNPSTLCHHIQKCHSNDSFHVCPTCKHDFLHKFALETHIASRHPELSQKVKSFHCDVQGCDFESITRGNLQIHKARKHYADLVANHLEIVEVEKKKNYRCKCCQKDSNSSTAFNHHILKCLEDHLIPLTT